MVYSYFNVLIVIRCIITFNDIFYGFVNLITLLKGLPYSTLKELWGNVFYLSLDIGRGMVKFKTSFA